MNISNVQEPASLNESIFVKVLGGKTLTLPFDPASKLCRYYIDIEQRENIPIYYQLLFYEGKQLKGSDNLSDYSIPPGAILHLKLITIMRIFIRTLEGKTITLDIKLKDSINSIKQKIQDKEGVLPDHQRLLFKGRCLDDDRTPKDYKICPGSTLHLVSRFRCGESPLLPSANMEQENMTSSVCSVSKPVSLSQSIFVKVSDEKTLELSFDPASKLCNYYKDIEQREGVPAYYQQLSYEGKRLLDNDTLSDYSIPPGATLRLKYLKIPSVMQIFVNNLQGKTISLDVKPADSIDNIKQKIKDKDGVPTDHMRLIFKGVTLQEGGRTLADYRVYPGSTFHLTLYTRGGGPSPLPFVNMEKEKMLPFNKGAPDWRIVRPGLNLSGECINSICQAFQEAIWIPKGFGTFNINKECKTSLCPICKTVADKVNNFGVYSCLYSIKGSFKNGISISPIPYEKQKTRAPVNQLLSFNDGEELIGEWHYLNITTEMLENPNQQKTEKNDTNQTQNSEADECTLF